MLRALAGEYMQCATTPGQQEKIALWRALNRCDMQRPMITMDQLPWQELACDTLNCRISDEYWRKLEQQLRQSIYQHRYFPVDVVLDPCVVLPFCEDQTVLAQAREIFEGVAPVRMSGLGFHLGVWDKITEELGVDECYFAFYDEPERLHAEMQRRTDEVICQIEQANALGLHDDNATLCHCSHVFTDELLPDCGAGHGPQSKNCWAFGLAQLMTATSPDIFEEFELPYITRMAAHFGAIYYGCCDRLDDRLDLVKRIPNVRKVSCSPWSNKENFAQQLGTKLVLSAKPNPAYLADTSMDDNVVRRELEEYCTLAKAYGLSLEFLLKDVSTIKKDPARLTRWADIAMQVVQNY